MPNERCMCPVCGFPDLDELPYDSQGCASFNICPSCGVEFGYDNSGASFEELRRRWIDGGMLWFSQANKPPRNWDPVQQLKSAALLD